MIRDKATSRQHLIDPETCIRCNTCESRCPVDAISHNDDNYVVDPGVCRFCMDCVGPCPTGAIDNWYVVARPYTVAEQLGWRELPPRSSPPDVHGDLVVDAFDDEAATLLETAHWALGGPARAPESASKPRINLFTRKNPAIATVTGNFRVTDAAAGSDVRYIILDFGAVSFPFLEGQSIGVIPPGEAAPGQPHTMRLYSVASPRDGERPNTNNLALTVKRVTGSPARGRPPGIASNWLCDLEQGDRIEVVGPFGATFLMPDDPDADLLMICTGTGVAPFRGFMLRRLRTTPHARGRLHLYFGARSPEELPYFGRLQKYPPDQFERELVFSRLPGAEKEYVQDRMRRRAQTLAALLRKDTLHIYVCGLRGLEEGVEQALSEISREHGIDWPALRTAMRDAGRYHIETY